MVRRRHLAATALGSMMLAASATPALAGETWCDIDPPVVIRTPAGNLRVVYVVASGPPQYLLSLLLPRISWEVKPVQSGGATQVSLDVTVAGLLFGSYGVKSEVWTGPLRTGTLLSSRTGESGDSMRHVFTLDVP